MSRSISRFKIIIIIKDKYIYRLSYKIRIRIKSI